VAELALGGRVRRRLFLLGCAPPEAVTLQGRITAMKEQDVIFILGMGRSGTSALARILSLCGCALPALLKDANEANPSGFWEPRDALKLNDEFLFRHRATYFDPTLRLQGELTFAPDETEHYIAQIRGFLTDCPKGAPLVIKDPRITGLFGFWREAVHREGFGIKVIVVVRNPSEVAASLGAWIQASPELWHAVWLKYNLLAELHSRHLPRVFVEYSRLLGDWRSQIARISRSLALNQVTEEGAAGIDAFLTLDLYRHRCRGPIIESFGYSWLSDTYTALAEAADDRPLDVAKLDEIFRAYRTCERAFRISLDDSRGKLLPLQLPQDGIMTWKREAD
jgi:hypothetical protein